MHAHATGLQLLSDSISGLAHVGPCRMMARPSANLFRVGRQNVGRVTGCKDCLCVCPKARRIDVDVIAPPPMLVIDRDS